MNTISFIQYLIERFRIEQKKRDRSGIYGFTQRLMAYNSNKIEGSTLTEEQTASLFDTGTLPKSDDYYRAKDVEEMNGHFLMFYKNVGYAGFQTVAGSDQTISFRTKKRGF